MSISQSNEQQVYTDTTTQNFHILQPKSLNLQNKNTMPDLSISQSNDQKVNTDTTTQNFHILHQNFLNLQNKNAMPDLSILHQTNDKGTQTSQHRIFIF